MVRCQDMTTKRQQKSGNNSSNKITENVCNLLTVTYSKMTRKYFESNGSLMAMIGFNLKNEI